MLSSQTATPDSFEASSMPVARWRSLVEPWTDECPDPAHWLKTTGLEYVRSKVDEALRSGPGPILVSGPTGHGKTLLLRSLRTRAPTGFVPLLVPFSNVEPREIARWILANTLSHVVGDPAVELTALLQANVRSGWTTLLLMDEVQSSPPATLAKLFELLSESGVAVSVVLAGLPGEELDQVLAAIPLSIQKIEVAGPWTRVDAELLLTQVALTLGVPATDLITAVDVDAALSASAGNPRLVRAALGQQLRFTGPARARIVQVAPARTLLPSTPRAPIFATPEPPAPIAFVDCTPSGSAMAIAPAKVQGPSQWQRLRTTFALRQAFHGARIRFRSRLYATAVRNKGAVWMRQLRGAVAIAVRSLSRRFHEVLMGAQQVLRRGRQSPRFPAHYGFAIAGILAVLGASVAIGRVPIPKVMSLSGDWGAASVEPIVESIPFRLNSQPWAIVEVDGVESGSTPFTISLEPGSHHFRVVMADGRIHEEVLVVSLVHDRHAFR